MTTFELFEQLQSLILDQYSNRIAHRAFRQTATEAQKELEGVARAHSHALLRLSHALQHWEDARADKATGTADLTVLIRQVARVFGPIKLPTPLWQTIRNRAIASSLFPSKENNEIVTVHATQWQPDWLRDQGSIGELVQRRNITPTIGDGIITNLTGGAYTTYQSLGQKRAVDAVLFAPPGSTILINLPTGGGKSMCITIPAWLASRGGRQRGGVTLVIVPTVSLAIDQYKQVGDYFVANKPQSLTGGTEADVFYNIQQGLSDGTLPILYTSPEKLLNDRLLYETVLKIAEQGLLNWLVIDEAHIVEQWGAGFRTEFQLLATYRRKLLAKSRKQLRTLLLSATISTKSQSTLRKLFSEGNNFTAIIANQLRPEISYWFSVAPDEKIRQSRILEALYNLPRPAILYVTQPKQANEWLTLLHSNGFNRIAAYSGDTQPKERQAIMREWDRNERDLIVATSAFGLGVNKEDIRTVVHASLPENTDRFYQEVGRGGRDGCTATSLVCVVKEDYKLVKQMTNPSHVTAPKAWPRWRAMWQSSKPYRDLGGDHGFVDLDAAPNYNPEINRNETHRTWNEHILLLMQRAGLIEIQDTQPGMVGHEQVADSEYKARDWLLIRLLEPQVAHDETTFRYRFDPTRSAERKRIVSDLNNMQRIVHSYADTPDAQPPQGCLAHELANIYPSTSLACGGCPYCRRYGRVPYAELIDIDCEENMVWENSTGNLDARFNNLFRHHNSVNVILDGVPPTSELAALLATLLSTGFQQFILPAILSNNIKEANKLIQALTEYSSQRHRLILDSWLTGNNKHDWSLYQLPTAVLYPLNEHQADKLYQCIKAKLSNMPIVHIVQRELYLPSEQRQFLERVNGLEMSVGNLKAHLVRLRDTLPM